MSRTQKIIIGIFGFIVFCVVCSVIAILIDGTSQTRAAPTANVAAISPTIPPSPIPTNTETSVPPSVTPHPAPTETPDSNSALNQLATHQFGARLNSATYVEGDLKLALIEYDLGPQPTDDGAVLVAVEHFIRFAPLVFAEFPKTDKLKLTAKSNFVDLNGNTTSETAFMFLINRDTSNKVNWSNFNPYRLGELLRQSGNQVLVHPALQKAWQAFEAQAN